MAKTDTTQPQTVPATPAPAVVNTLVFFLPELQVSVEATSAKEAIKLAGSKSNG